MRLRQVPGLRRKDADPRVRAAASEAVKELFGLLLGVFRLRQIDSGLSRAAVLGIETSCDDTGIALMGFDGKVLASLLSSQIKDHAAFGGVVPELASRKHQEAILPLLRAALSDAGITEPAREIGLVAVTTGPGLMGSLLVGVMTAKGLAQAWNCPMIGVNHIEGHIFANRIAHEGLAPPFLCLVVSGGHTEIILVRAWGDYSMVGRTRDDAAGECYDKVARILGLPYPGGPEVDRLASQGDPEAFDFPVPMNGTSGVEFSFSGLKTAVFWAVSRIRREGMEVPVADVCASFQKAAVSSLLGKVCLASGVTGVGKICLSGGVSANSALRAAFRSRFGVNAFIPPAELCTDNALMIAAAGLNRFLREGGSSLDIAPDPSATLSDRILSKNERNGQ
ncbi:MAG: tRNA (adenosine(37)-N6)-threonylcarbamoyltransferase complex transferase subunit TsaD [Thermovirgaceae bacterium]|nr:tRNA (adenosine(37)-N6)-threonylcarbamoyltransferase complex transferase subunit TsaD [Thermovirgaceae bacterium]